MAKLLTGTRIYGTGTVDTQLLVNGTEQATSTTTGALEVVGGVGIGGSLFVGGIATATNLVRLTNATEASTTNTGALTVAGGVGVGKDLRVGGTIYGTVIGSIVGTTTSATNIANGTVGQVPFQESPGITKFFGPGTAGQLLVSAGASPTGPVFTNTASIYVGRAGLADDLVGGAVGSIPYQDAANSTVFLGLGTAGFVMLAGTTAPVWVSTSTLVVGRASQSDSVLMSNNVADTAVNYLTFVSTTTGYTSLRGAAMSGLVYRPSTGDLGVGTGSPLYKLHVSEPTDKIAARIDRSTGGDVLELYNNSGVTGGFTQLSFLHRDSASAAVSASKISGYATSLASGAVSGGLIFSSVNAGTIAEAARFNNLGHLGLGNNNPIYKLDITGGVRMTGITTSTNATASTSPTTGALQLAGGAGIQGSVNASGQFVSTQANNAATAGGQIYLNGATGNRIDFNTNGIAAPAFTNRSAGTKIVYSPALTGSAVDYATGVETGSLWNSVPSTTDSFRWYGATTLAASLTGAGLLTLSSDLATSASTFNLVDATATTVNFARAATAITIGSNVSGTTTVRNVLAISTTTPTTTINNGALTVAGGVGIAGDLRIGGTFFGNVSVSGVITTATNVANGTAGQLVYQSAPGVTAFAGPGTAGNVLVSNGTGAPTYNNTLALTGSTAATNATSGALTVAGGVGIGGALFVSGIANANAFVATGTAPPAGTTVNFSVLSGGAWINSPTGTLGYLATANNGILSWSGTAVNIITSTAASSTNTGALQVAGGVGIGGNAFLGGDLSVGGGDIVTPATTFNLIDATATTVNFARAATALTMGAATGVTTVQNNLTVAGNLTVQGTTTQVNSTVTNVSDPIFTIGTGPLGANPIADDNRDRGIAFKWHNGTSAQDGFFGYDDSTGFMTFVPNATLANEVVSGTRGAIDVNLAGGTAQSLVYQSAANTTAFLPAGTSGHILQTNGTGSAPSWVPTSGLSAGTADTVRTVAQTANGNYFLTFVDSNNATALGEAFFTTSSFVVNPSTGNVGIGTGTPRGMIDVVGTGVSAQRNWAYIAGGNVGAQNPVSLATGIAVASNFSNGQSETNIVWGQTVGAQQYLSFARWNGTAVVEQVRITSAGDVGIGTSPVFSGGSGLEIQRTGTATLRLDSASFATEFRAQTNGTEIFQLSAGYLDLGTSATTRIRVTSAGDVGIGVTAPSKRLQVDSGATATGGQAWSHSAGTVYARVGVVNPGVSNDTEFGSVSNNSLRLITNNAERARITETGIVLVNSVAASTNGSLQVSGNIGLQGNSQIRQASNADGNTLQVFATQFVAAATNSGSYGYTGAGLIASVSAAANQILLDAGGQTAGHRLRVINGADGIQGRLAYSNFGVERFAVDSTTGNTFITTTTNATSETTGALQVAGGVGIGGSMFVGGLYTSPTRTLALTLGTESWVRLCTLVNRCAVKIQIGTGSSNSEEEAEIEVFGTFNLANIQINVKRQTYNEHLREVRVTQATAGGPKVVYVRLRTTSFAPNINWRLFSSRGVTSLDNIVETPGVGESVLVDQANGYFTNALTEIANTTQATSTTTGALQVFGGVGIGGNLHVGGTIFGAVSGSAGSATNAANVAITNDNATTTDQYVTFVSGSSGNLPVKVSATTGLVWKPNTGSLGLGISPSSRLHVDASTAGGGAIFSRQGFNYATVSQLGSSADAIFGGGVIASATNAQVAKTVADVAHFIKLQISDGITFHTNITGSAGASVDRATNERMRINSNGNASIGGTADVGRLGVWGQISKITASGVDGTFDNLIRYGTSADLSSGGATANRWVGIDGTVTAGTAVSNVLRVRAYPGTTANAIPVTVADFRGDLSTVLYGNTGVGTSTLNTRLSVQAAGANGIALLQDTGATANSGRLFLQASGGTFALTNVNNTLQFASGSTVGSDTGTSRMVLNASGFLGVGTTQVPLTFLDVRSNNSSSQASQVAGFTLRTNENNGMEWHLQHTNGYTGWVAAARVNNTGASFGQGYLEFITAGASGGNQVSTMALHGNGNVSIGSTAAPTFRLFVNGSFAATTKSFVIDHPTKEGHKLRYGSLEGPENGVYVRGRLKDNNIIELPDYWTGLVDEDSITVNLTPVGKHQKLYVEDIADNTVTVGTESDQPINCFYTVWAERKDVNKLVVEYKEQEI